MSRVGPIIRSVTTSECHGCVHLESEKYSVEDGNDVDWGFDYYCKAAGRRIMDTPSKTPAWCPYPNGAAADSGGKGGSGG